MGRDRRPLAGAAGGDWCMIGLLSPMTEVIWWHPTSSSTGRMGDPLPRRPGRITPNGMSLFVTSMWGGTQRRSRRCWRSLRVCERFRSSSKMARSPSASVEP